MFRKAAFIREGEAPAEPGLSNGIRLKWEGEAPAEPRLSKDPALHALSPLFPPPVFRGKRVELATAHERVQEGGCISPSPSGRGQGEGELRATLTSSGALCRAGFQACTPHIPVCPKSASAGCAHPPEQTRQVSSFEFRISNFIRHSNFVIRICALTCFFLTLTPSLTRAQSPPATQPGVDLTEWLILIAEPKQLHANASPDILSPLPESLDPLRLIDSPDSASRPAPIGVIRFTGQSDSTFSLRLTGPEDTIFYTTWPPAHTRARVAEWPDLKLSTTPQRLVPQSALQWLAPLRTESTPYITTAGRSEKFLLYDADLPFSLPIALEPSKAEADGDKVLLRNNGESPLHDVFVYRPLGNGGWATAHADQVPPHTEPAASSTFSSPATDPARLLEDDWKPRLESLELNPADQTLILATLKTYALDENQTTAVYRLDEPELNRLLQLQISPRPAKIRRLALVIARNIDPDLPQTLDRLVAQLGDKDWHKRESATRSLARFGPTASPRLREALHNNDPEIVLRAERLLARNAAR